jgi:Zn-dependent membrane protease YugP
MPVLLGVLVLVLLLWGPRMWVQYVLTRYNREQESNFPGNGGELARHLLDRFGLQAVQVEVTEHGDHYDPQQRAVRLSRDKLEGRSLTAITVAAHEVGHALQHAAGDPLFAWRQRLVAMAAHAQRLGSLLLLATPVVALLLKLPAPSVVTLLAGFLMMGVGVVVQLVTLPVELDASFRKALPLLSSGYLSPSQHPAARRILRAAAWTYVAASLSSLLNLWAWLRLLRR